MEIQSALIVDDSKMARISLKKQLEKRGIKTHMSASGEESIEFLQKKRTDIVFMDCLMPGMDGFEAMTQILKKPENAELPIVICSGKESDSDKEKAFELGAMAYLCKSRSSEPLDAILDKLAKQEKFTNVIQTTELESDTHTDTDTNQDMVEATKDETPPVENLKIEEFTLLAENIVNNRADKIQQDLNDQIASLKEQTEQMLLYSVKSSLEEGHNYIDNQVLPINSVIKTVDSKLVGLETDLGILKTQIDQNDIEKLIDHHIKVQLGNNIEQQIDTLLEEKIQQSLQSNMDSYATTLLHNEYTQSVMDRQIEAKTANFSRKIEELHHQIAANKKSIAPIIFSALAFLLGTGALALSGYMFLY